MNKKAAILLADGFEEIEATTPYDLLNRAGVDTVFVSVQNKKMVKGTIGLEVENVVDMKDFDFSAMDALIVPGGEGYAIIEQNPECCELIKQFANNPDKTLGAICAGASIPGKLGLYKGKNYTCVPGLNGDFGGNYEKTWSVIDGNIITGISVGGAFEFALNLIRRLQGEEAADAIAADTFYKL